MYIDWNGREQEDPEMDAMREDAAEERREALKQERRKAAKLVRAFFAGLTTSEVGQIMFPGLGDLFAGDVNAAYANAAQFEPPKEETDDSHTTPPLDYVDPSWTPPGAQTLTFQFVVPIGEMVGLTPEDIAEVQLAKDHPGIRLIYFLHTVIHRVIDADPDMQCLDLHEQLIQEAFARKLVTAEDIALWQRQREKNR